jgi:pSer/pThr/pTyr-binding forkhead associated (FHA) protein
MVIEIEGEAELYIGRSTPNEAMAPEIDLNKVNGSMYGVSRMHAAITRRDNKLLIADLGSMNQTRINGTRLVPDDIRTLENGDEIWFGHLRCQIRFKHNER